MLDSLMHYISMSITFATLPFDFDRFRILWRRWFQDCVLSLAAGLDRCPMLSRSLKRWPAQSLWSWRIKFVLIFLIRISKHNFPLYPILLTAFRRLSFEWNYIVDINYLLNSSFIYVNTNYIIATNIFEHHCCCHLVN